MCVRPFIIEVFRYVEAVIFLLSFVSLSSCYGEGVIGSELVMTEDLEAGFEFLLRRDLG